eukprot:IDg15480t1
MPQPQLLRCSSHPSLLIVMSKALCWYSAFADASIFDTVATRSALQLQSALKINIWRVQPSTARYSISSPARREQRIEKRGCRPQRAYNGDVGGELCWFDRMRYKVAVARAEDMDSRRRNGCTTVSRLRHELSTRPNMAQYRVVSHSRARKAQLKAERVGAGPRTHRAEAYHVRALAFFCAHRG